MATQPQNLSREMAHAYLTGTASRTNRLSSPACQPIMTLFMQNKANLLDAQMNVSSVRTTNYEQITMNNANKKQTQYKPNFRNAQMNVSSVLTKYYENETAFRLRENKPNQTQFPKSQNEIKLLFNKGL